MHQMKEVQEHSVTNSRKLLFCNIYFQTHGLEFLSKFIVRTFLIKNVHELFYEMVKYVNHKEEWSTQNMLDTIFLQVIFILK